MKVGLTRSLRKLLSAALTKEEPLCRVEAPGPEDLHVARPWSWACRVPAALCAGTLASLLQGAHHARGGVPSSPNSRQGPYMNSEGALVAVWLMSAVPLLDVRVHVGGTCTHVVCGVHMHEYTCKLCKWGRVHACVLCPCVHR